MLALQMLNTHSGEWLTLNESSVGLSCEPCTDFSACVKRYTAHPFILLFPGEQLRLTVVKLPKMRFSQRVQAIPYVLEEQLISDPDGLHVAVGAAQHQGDCVVALLEKNRLDEILTLCQRENCFPACAIPDFLAIFWEQDAWSIVLKNQMALVRIGFDSGFKTDQKNLFLSLQLALEKYPDHKPKRFLYWGQGHEITCDHLQSLGIPLEIMDDKKQPPFDLHSFAYPPINLLQGKYTPKLTSVKIPKNWRFCVIAASAWILSLFAGQFSQWLYFSQESKQLENRIHAQYRVLFPGAHAVLVPRARTDHLLKQYTDADQNTRWLKVFSTAGKILTRFPDITLQSVNFDGKQLQFNLQVDQMSGLMAYVKQLQAQGFLVRQHVDTDAPHVSAIFIKLPGSPDSIGY